MRIRRRKKRGSEFILIPMIDIMLMLLIFFMLTTNFVTQTAHDIDLPDSRTATVLKEKEIKIYVTRNHKIFLNEALVTMDTLPGRLRPILARDPEKVVILKADADTQLGYTVGIIDIVKENGGKRLTITTEKVAPIEYK
jgi:biopolymer transport protein ExbD